jgi:hypothetical protein
VGEKPGVAENMGWVKTMEWAKSIENEIAYAKGRPSNARRKFQVAKARASGLSMGAFAAGPGTPRPQLIASARLDPSPVFKNGRFAGIP